MVRFDVERRRRTRRKRLCTSTFRHSGKIKAVMTQLSVRHAMCTMKSHLSYFVAFLGGKQVAQ